MNKDILIEKYDLVMSEEYSKTRSYQLENIVRLANSDINPLILQGMLKVIADTDKWKADFESERRLASRG
ncbi:hypothetical protein IJ674_10390 [bacterium]|nr:hypothetical protein [bacterium]